MDGFELGCWVYGQGLRRGAGFVLGELWKGKGGRDLRVERLEDEVLDGDLGWTGHSVWWAGLDDVQSEIAGVLVLRDPTILAGVSQSRCGVETGSSRSYVV